MKNIITVILLALTFTVFAQDDILMQDAITKPALSTRCKELFKDRSHKITVQQRLNALLQRNTDLIKRTPKNKMSIHTRLKASQIKVKNELQLTTMNIESQEENIVRSGCPGLAL
jgi:hypothetical protein